MDKYTIKWKKSAVKELSSLPKEVINRIIIAVEKLKDNPYSNSKKLVGTSHSYRIRISDYRVVYTIQNDTLVIEIIKVSHRRNVYK